MKVHISPLRFRQALRLLVPFLFALTGLAVMSLTIAQSRPLQLAEEATSATTETSAKPLESSHYILLAKVDPSTRIDGLF